MFIGEDEKSPLDNNKTNRSDKKTDNNKLLNASSLVWSRAGFPTGHDAKPKASGKATQARGSEKKQTPPKNKSSKSVMLMVDGGGTDNKNNQGEEKKKKRKKKKKSKGKASVKDGTGGMREGPGQGLRGAGAGVPFKVTLTPHLLPPPAPIIDTLDTPPLISLTCYVFKRNISIRELLTFQQTHPLIANTSLPFPSFITIPLLGIRGLVCTFL